MKFFVQRYVSSTTTFTTRVQNKLVVGRRTFEAALVVDVVSKKGVQVVKEIVKTALLHNTLVALPTGLGKVGKMSLLVTLSSPLVALPHRPRNGLSLMSRSRPRARARSNHPDRPRSRRRHGYHRASFRRRAATTVATAADRSSVSRRRMARVQPEDEDAAPSPPLARHPRP